MAYRAPMLVNGPADLAVERNAALAIAGAWLEGQMNALVQMVPGDPDCDACVMARTLIRSLQRVSEIDCVVDAARELAEDLRVSLTRAGPEVDAPALEVKLIDAVDALAMRLKPPEC